MAITTVVLTPASTVCGPPSHHSLPSRSAVTTEFHLRRKVILSSAHMEVLMQHCQAAGFSEGVSRLAMAPKRPSTNHMYDNRWLHFAHWVARQGIDLPAPKAAPQIATFLYPFFDTHGLLPQMLTFSPQPHRQSSSGSEQRFVSGMIASMELQRPRVKTVLPQ